MKRLLLSLTALTLLSTASIASAAEPQVIFRFKSGVLKEVAAANPTPSVPEVEEPTAPTVPETPEVEQPTTPEVPEPTELEKKYPIREVSATKELVDRDGDGEMDSWYVKWDLVNESDEELGAKWEVTGASSPCGPIAVPAGRGTGCGRYVKLGTNPIRMDLRMWNDDAETVRTMSKTF